MLDLSPSEPTRVFDDNWIHVVPPRRPWQPRRLVLVFRAALDGTREAMVVSEDVARCLLMQGARGSAGD